jgi:hypothetical protein
MLPDPPLDARNVLILPLFSLMLLCSEPAQDSAAAGSKTANGSERKLRSEVLTPISSRSTITVVLDGVAEGKMLSQDCKRCSSVFNLEFEDPCGHARLMNPLGISIWEGELEDGEPSQNGAAASHRAVDIAGGDVGAM